MFFRFIHACALAPVISNTSALATAPGMDHKEGFLHGTRFQNKLVRASSLLNYDTVDFLSKFMLGDAKHKSSIDYHSMSTLSKLVD